MEFGANIDGLVEKAKGGSADAFGELFDLFLTPIYRFVYFRVDTVEDAEDLTEDVFLKAWENLESFQKRKNIPFSAWLFQIAKNRVTDYYRQKRDIIEIPDDEPDKNAESEIIRYAEKDFQRDKLLSALQEIPALQADAVSLKYFSDLSNQEIATVLKKSEGAVRILLSRGLKKLREVMEESETK